MQTNVISKRILLCLLICTLFLTSYTSVLNTNGIISSDIFDFFSTSGRSEHSSMSGGASAGLDYLAAADTSLESSIFSVKQLRWLSIKTSLSILTAIVITQIACLIYYSRLSDQTYTQSYSSVITVFLHKKDGMK
ncbi:MAG: hypothetical protein AAGU27_05120 [Dehalobacterium sp.]